MKQVLSHTSVPWLVSILFLGQVQGFAQEDEKPQAPTGQAPAIDVESAVQEARAILDRIDVNYAEPPSRETLLELERLIDAIQAANPAHPWLSYLLGRAYALAGRSGDAIDQLRRFVETRDGRNDWKAHCVLGDLFVTEFPRLAQGSYEKAAQLNPNEPWVLSGLSNCAHRSGRIDEAIRLARLAAEADGQKSVRYLHRLARALMVRQMWDEAEPAALKAVSIAETRASENPGKRSSLQTLLDQYGLVIEVLSSRIATSSEVNVRDYLKLTDFMNNRTDVMARLGRHDQIAVLESAVTRTEPDTPMELRERLATELAQVHRVEDAIKEYEKILAAQAGHEKAQAALEQLRSLRETPTNVSP